MVEESGFHGNTGGFSTEDDAGFCHFSSFSLSLSLSLHISLSMEVVGGVVVWWVANQWKRVAAVSGCQQRQ